MYHSIDDIFSTYITNTKDLVKRLYGLHNSCTDDEGAINSLIGIRILEYVGKNILNDRKLDTLNNTELSRDYPVRRDWENQSLQYLYKVSLNDSERTLAEHATQMKINS
jgi:hypothetical protein